MAHPKEYQAQVLVVVAQRVYGMQQRQRIEPAADATRPKHDFVPRRGPQRVPHSCTGALPWRRAASPASPFAHTEVQNRTP
jgi:hypothetical protein